jgi:hypothetical protein
MHNYKMKDPPNQRKYKEQFKDYFYYVENWGYLIPQMNKGCDDFEYL